MAVSARETNCDVRSLPNRRSRVGTSLPIVGVRCPAFRPLAPKPQAWPSMSTTRMPSERSASAVDRPVYPPPTMTASAWTSPRSTGAGVAASTSHGLTAAAARSMLALPVNGRPRCRSLDFLSRCSGAVRLLERNEVLLGDRIANPFRDGIEPGDLGGVRLDAGRYGKRIRAQAHHDGCKVRVRCREFPEQKRTAVVGQKLAPQHDDAVEIGAHAVVLAEHSCANQIG